MITLAAITGPLPKAAVVAVAVVVAAALLHRSVRVRAAAMLAALCLAPILLFADIWHSPQLRMVHRHPLLALALTAVGLAVVAAVAVVIARRPALFAPLAVIALPFRIPIQAGGTTSNLLVPLYLVVAAGSLAFIWLAVRPHSAREHASAFDAGDSLRVGWVDRLLALYVVLYGLQAIYSSGFEHALQQMVFFYVPFALLFCVLRRMSWTPRLLGDCAKLLAGLAVLFAVFGFVEYATKTLFLNPKLIAANSVHTYFTVNSVFFDPDIFGRFLALVMILLAAALLYGRSRRQQVSVIAVLAVLWGALVLTLSRSSLAALLVGLGTLAALRSRLSRVLVVAGVVVVIGAVAVAVSPKTFGLDQGLNGASSGRAGLVSGGLTLFADRPVWGFGSGSFETEFHARHRHQELSASHTIAITIAAEQGLIGELPYIALVVAAFVTLLRGARSDPARAAIGAAFVALVFHTLLYADFLEDPVTWTLLGVGCALAYARRREAEPVGERPIGLATVAA